MNVDVRFDTWIETLLENNNCTNVDDLTLDVIKDEISNMKLSIENENNWEMGAATLEESDMHRENIIAMQEYVIYLRELERERDNNFENDYVFGDLPF